MTKKTVTGIPVKSWEEVDKLLLEYAKLESFLTETEADLNRKLQSVRDEFAKVTANQAARYNQIQNDIQQFALSQKHEFEKSRCKEFPYAKIGFRYGKQQVATLNRKYNWDIVIKLVKQVFGKAYIRLKEELNKEQILADYTKNKITDKDVAACGMKIEQKENFYIELKWDEIKEN